MRSKPPRVSLGEQLHRQALVLDAQKYRRVDEQGRPVRFTEPEAARIAFTRWLYEHGALHE